MDFDDTYLAKVLSGINVTDVESMDVALEERLSLFQSILQDSLIDYPLHGSLDMCSLIEHTTSSLPMN